MGLLCASFFGEPSLIVAKWQKSTEKVLEVPTRTCWLLVADNELLEQRAASRDGRSEGGSPVRFLHKLIPPPRPSCSPRDGLR